MLYQIFSMLLSLLGLGSAAVVFLLSFHSILHNRRFILFLYLVVSLLFASAMVRGLVISSSLLACSRIPFSMLVLTVLLLLLHLYFIIDLYRSASKTKNQTAIQK